MLFQEEDIEKYSNWLTNASIISLGFIINTTLQIKLRSHTSGNIEQLEFILFCISQSVILGIFLKAILFFNKRISAPVIGELQEIRRVLRSGRSKEATSRMDGESQEEKYTQTEKIDFSRENYPEIGKSHRESLENADEEAKALDEENNKINEELEELYTDFYVRLINLLSEITNDKEGGGFAFSLMIAQALSLSIGIIVFMEYVIDFLDGEIDNRTSHFSKYLIPCMAVIVGLVASRIFLGNSRNSVKNIFFWLGRQIRKNMGKE